MAAFQPTPAPPERPASRPAALEAGMRRLRTAMGGHAAILRAHGATVGPGCSFRSPVLVAAGQGGFRNLVVGAGVSFGPGVILDLSAPLRVGAHATIGPRCSLGASDRGAAGETFIGPGAVLEPGVVVCRGVTIGEGSWIGGHAVVTSDVPAGARVESPALRDLNARG